MHIRTYDHFRLPFATLSIRICLPTYVLIYFIIHARMYGHIYMDAYTYIRPLQTSICYALHTYLSTYVRIYFIIHARMCGRIHTYAYTYLRPLETFICYTLHTYLSTYIRTYLFHYTRTHIRMHSYVRVYVHTTTSNFHLIFCHFPAEKSSSSPRRHGDGADQESARRRSSSLIGRSFCIVTAFSSSFFPKSARSGRGVRCSTSSQKPHGSVPLACFLFFSFRVVATIS
jgi:hypothetical protein